MQKSMLKNPMSLGNFIKEAYLLPLDMPEEELSKSSGISMVTLKSILAGELSLTQEGAIKLSKVLGCSPQSLLSFKI